MGKRPLAAVGWTAECTISMIKILGHQRDCDCLHSDVLATWIRIAEDPKTPDVVRQNIVALRTAFEEIPDDAATYPTMLHKR